MFRSTGNLYGCYAVRLQIHYHRIFNNYCTPIVGRVAQSV